MSQKEVTVKKRVSKVQQQVVQISDIVFYGANVSTHGFPR